MSAQGKRQLVQGAAEVFRRGNSGESGEELTVPLYEEIGQLKMEIDWFKKSLECVVGLCCINQQ
ncbi:MAG: hypothetical protein AB1563_02365 [Bacillota bacterium]